jgi:hypothetical protein
MAVKEGHSMLQHGTGETKSKPSPKKAALLMGAVKGAFKAQLASASNQEMQLTIAYSTDQG